MFKKFFVIVAVAVSVAAGFYQYAKLEAEPLAVETVTVRPGEVRADLFNRVAKAHNLQSSDWSMEDSIEFSNARNGEEVRWGHLIPGQEVKIFIHR